MSAGTLTLTHNSDVITGNGTAFTTDLVAGDFVVTTVGGVTYTLPVKSVDSDTEITIIRKYPGPTQQGSAWNAVPRATQNRVTAALVDQSTEALRGLNYDKQNWQSVFSVDGNITVFLPDGSSFSGPSWKSIAETLSTLDVDYLNQLAAQINQDAQQVEANKNMVVDTAQQVSTDAQTASTAATGAQGSATEAAQSETNAEDYKELARKYALNPEDSPVPGQTNSFGNWQKLISTQRTYFLTGDTDTPTGGVVFGFSTGHAIAAAGQYGLQVCGRNSGMWFRSVEGGNFQGWQKVTSAAVCDSTLKDEITDTDGMLSLENIKAMELKTFVYKDDDKRRVRRGVIAQQIRNIDPCYVKEVHNGDEVNLVLDSNPLLLDAISAVKVLARKVEELQAELMTLKGE